jgi:hypothetical protein
VSWFFNISEILAGPVFRAKSSTAESSSNIYSAGLWDFGKLTCPDWRI